MNNNGLIHRSWLVVLALAGSVLMIAPAHAQDKDAHFEQRLAACVSCHGEQGAGSETSTHIPRLAGKPAPYLLQQLEFFQQGRRKNAVMEHMVRYLDKDYLSKIATYFATQDAPFYQHDAPEVSAETLARGKQLALEGDKAHDVPSCNSCHGERMTGVEPLIPGLMGLSYDYVTAQLHLWRQHARDAGGTFCMGVVANRMQESDIKAVSAYLASMDLSADMHPMTQEEQDGPLPGWCVVGDQEGGQHASN